MARPQKTNADYFPHVNNLRNDRRCKALRNKFHLEGYAVFIMLLEALTQADHFCIAYNPLEIELLAGDFDVDSGLLTEIIEHSLRLGLLQKKGTRIFSPLLEDLKTMLNAHRTKERERKKENRKKVFRAENSGSPLVFQTEKAVFHAENPVFQMENTQSKVKESKVKESKAKESKAKRENEIPPEKLQEKKEPGNEPQTEKEKNSAKKEKEVLSDCKAFFTQQAQVYIWEEKDEVNLAQLLDKIRLTIGQPCTNEQLLENFRFLIQKLPPYWRSKKFTIPNINQNFNEIINEIRSNPGKPSAPGSPDGGKFGRHNTAELANRAKTFGRKGLGN